jgi:3-oxoacyl-[acyl-carrier-protein] synthase-3
MIAFRFSSVCIESFAVDFPENEVSSSAIEQRLAPLYERLQIPSGTLAKLTGVNTRYYWGPTTAPSEVAATAGIRALDKIGFDSEDVRAVFNCSVTRDYFEPATAILVHRKLGIQEDSIAMDISNACLGFADGIVMLGSLIESGLVKAGLVVSGENISPIIDSSIDHLLKGSDIGRDELLRTLPCFTLGCGAVAFVLCHESIATQKHRLLGGVAKSASGFSDLCVGNRDYCLHHGRAIDPLMSTRASEIIARAAELGGRTWKAVSELLGWTRDDVDHIFCHQVGRGINEAFFREMGLDREKEFTIYGKYGNLASAALPAALAIGIGQKRVASGEKVLLTAFGSGLNSLFLGVEW